MIRPGRTATSSMAWARRMSARRATRAAAGLIGRFLGTDHHIFRPPPTALKRFRLLPLNARGMPKNLDGITTCPMRIKILKRTSGCEPTCCGNQRAGRRGGQTIIGNALVNSSNPKATLPIPRHNQGGTGTRLSTLVILPQWLCCANRKRAHAAQFPRPADGHRDDPL